LDTENSCIVSLLYDFSNEAARSLIEKSSWSIEYSCKVSLQYALSCVFSSWMMCQTIYYNQSTERVFLQYEVLNASANLLLEKRLLDSEYNYMASPWCELSCGFAKDCVMQMLLDTGHTNRGSLLQCELSCGSSVGLTGEKPPRTDHMKKVSLQCEPSYGPLKMSF
jgi:hypothetical protein